jgi:hypothetical protein
MILTPHAIVGAAIANIIPSEPALGFSLAFLSHYVLDTIPHKDYNINSFMNKNTKKVIPIFKNIWSTLSFFAIIFDFIFAIFICTIFFIRDGKSAIITMVGIIGAVLPDLFQYYYYKYKKQPFIFFQKINDRFSYDSDKASLFWGILSQIILPVIFLTLYFYITNL